MKKIIVAGAGHGGLVLAAQLAKNGYDVTVFEKREEASLGYDWFDSMRRSSFAHAEMDMPPEDKLFEADTFSYTNPKKTKKILSGDALDSVATIDRKFLINYLISNCRKCKVNFVFEAEILSALCSGDKVSGIKVLENGEEKDYIADLVVDAAGMDSPVRRTLPKSFGITNEIGKEDTFFVWRGYFAKIANIKAEQRCNIVFYHNQRMGMDWVITKEDAFDVLIGGFSALSQSDVDEALENFFSEYPNMSKELIRGGTFEKIPLKIAMPLFVANGYAAVGDSAIMTEPLSGSGISLSMKAGKMLADIVIKKGGDCTAANLWEYNYEYLNDSGFRYMGDYLIKSFLSAVSADDIDFLFEKKVLTARELCSSGEAYGLADILDKLSIIKKPKILAALAKTGKKMAEAELIKKQMPKEYDKEKINNWKEKYNKL